MPFMDFDATIVQVLHVCSFNVVQCRVMCLCVFFDTMKRSLNGLGKRFFRKENTYFDVCSLYISVNFNRLTEAHCVHYIEPRQLF